MAITLTQEERERFAAEDAARAEPVPPRPGTKRSREEAAEQAAARVEPKEVTLDPGEVATKVEQVPDQLRKEIVAAREAGGTLAELKRDFGQQVAPEVIREVLPPTNKREATARQKAQVVAEAHPGSDITTGARKRRQPRTDEETPTPAPRYATDLGDLPDRVLAARQVVGRNKLAELLGWNGSSVWRAEQGRIHPDEVKPLREAIAKVHERIAAGEFTKAAATPKAKRLAYTELAHRIEVAAELLATGRKDKGITKVALVDAALAVLVPAQSTEPE